MDSILDTNCVNDKFPVFDNRLCKMSLFLEKMLKYLWMRGHNGYNLPSNTSKNKTNKANGREMLRFGSLGDGYVGILCSIFEIFCELEIISNWQVKNN